MLRVNQLNGFGARRGGFILDQVTQPAAAAFSLRRLRSGYLGSAMRVRRSSDNAELDIGFTFTGDLNVSALIAHCGVNSGFDAILYDQSGNGRNLTQTTSGAQPRIVNAGVVDVLGGVPALVFDAVNDTMIAATWGTISQPFTRNAVIQLPALLSGFPHILNTATGTPNTAEFINTGSIFSQFAGSNGATRSISANERIVFTSRYDGATSNLSKNGSTSGDVNAGSNALAGLSLNRDVAGAVFGGTIFQEITIFESYLSEANRQILERNQGAYYGITVS
jgi:hypothetical protein